MAAPLLIRPITPEDRGLVADAFARLSPESRRLRFFSPIERLTERQLDFLTQIDQHDHVGLLAVDADSGLVAGIARFVRTGPGVAEPAVAVADAFQGRGVGGRLLDALVARALQEGIDVFAATILAENRAGLATFARLGPHETRRHGPEVELTVELHAPAQAPPRLREQLAVLVDAPLTYAQRLLRPEGPRGPVENVVVVALGDDDGPAVSAARALGRALRSELVLTAAAPHLGDLGRARDHADRQAASLRRAGRRVRTVVRRGDLGAVVLDEAVAARARVIVVTGTRPAAAPARLLGGVWDHVSHHAPCDVLVAR